MHLCIIQSPASREDHAGCGARGSMRNVLAGHLSAIDSDPFGYLISTCRFPLLREDASPRQRNAALSDALGAAVACAEAVTCPRF